MKIEKKQAFLLLYFALIILMTALGFKTSRDLSAVTEPVSDSALEQAFCATGAKLQNVFVSAWVYFGPQDQTMEGLKRIAEQTFAMLAGPAADIKSMTYAEICGEMARVTGETETRNIIVTAQVVRPWGEYGVQAGTYLTVDVEEKGDSVDVRGLENKVMNAIGEKGDSFAITTCLSGWVSGKLEEEKMTQVIRQAFQRVRAQTEEGITSPHFVSYAGMADSIHRSVTVRKKNINLNIAMRHHSTEDRTYVTAASPIITREY